MNKGGKALDNEEEKLNWGMQLYIPIIPKLSTFHHEGWLGYK